MAHVVHSVLLETLHCRQLNDSHPERSRFPCADSDPLQLINNVVVSRKKGSPYSITERRVPQLIPVLGSQPAW